MSSAEEATLIARAESLIRQYNFVGARLLLAHALEKGSANAAFMMAQTYDWRILRSLRAYGVRGDAAMAREFYQQAATAGIEEAQERVEALQPNANVDTPVGGEKRSRPESRQRGRFASPNGPF
jgi:TPR repeat protein